MVGGRCVVALSPPRDDFVNVKLATFPTSGMSPFFLPSSPLAPPPVFRVVRSFACPLLSGG